MNQMNQFPDITNLIECGCCGYPLTWHERKGLVEINGKMHKPWVELTNDQYDKLEKRYGDVKDLVLLDIIADVSTMVRANNR